MGILEEAAAAAPAVFAAPAADPVRNRSGWGVARVFVSSTFRDMEGERCALVQKVFPALRTWAETELRVRVTEIDLRWGVAAEDTARAAEICLREVAACAPFCIAILGERFGWCPEAWGLPGDDPLFAWAARVPAAGTTSITALEVYAAILMRAVATGERNRDAVVLERLWDRSDVPAAMGDVVARICTDALGDKQAALKRSLREHCERRLEYTARFDAVVDNRVVVDPGAAFADFAATQLKEVLLARFGRAPPPVGAATEQRRIAADAAEFVVGREAELARIAAYLAAPSDGRVLLLVAASGVGKTTVVARAFCDHVAAGHPAVIAMVGTSAQTTDGRGCGLALLEQLGLEGKMSLPEIGLALEAGGGGAAIFADGLNQLGDDLLAWLPPAIAPDAHMVLSVIGETAAHATILARDLDLEIVEVARLGRDASRSVVSHLLGFVGKRLTEAQLDTLCNKTDGGVPVYLKAACEELRRFGAFEGLDSEIARLPECTAPLFTMVIEGLESRSDGAAGKVQAALTAIHVSRAGLSEAAVVQSSGWHAAGWARVHDHLRRYLREGDRLAFFHQQVGDAVAARYGAEALCAARRRVAEHAVAHGSAAERWREACWQYFQLRDGAALGELLLDWEVFGSVCYDRLNAPALASYVDLWDPHVAAIQGGSQVKRGWAYALLKAGRAEQSVELIMAVEPGGAQTEEAAAVWHQQARSLHGAGRLAEARQRYERALDIRTGAGGGGVKTSNTLNDLARLLVQLGESRSDALALYQRALVIREEHLGRDHLKVGDTLLNIASVSDDPAPYYHRALSIHEAKLGVNHPTTVETRRLLEDAEGASE